jgi:transcriptional regulator with GAF, ATPase, and Fis domain
MNNETGKEILLRDQEYNILHEVTRNIRSCDDLNTLLERLLVSFICFDELKVEYKAGIFLADEEKKVLRLFTTIGEFTDEFLEKEKEIPYGQCLCGRAAVSGELLISNNCFKDDRHENKFEGMTAHGHYIVPLKSVGKLIGVLFLYTDKNPSFYIRSQEFLLDIGTLIANAIISHHPNIKSK